MPICFVIAAVGLITENFMMFTCVYLLLFCHNSSNNNNNNLGITTSQSSMCQSARSMTIKSHVTVFLTALAMRSRVKEKVQVEKEKCD